MSEATPDSTAPVADNVEHAVEIDSASTKTCTGPSAADLDLQQSTVPQNMEGGAEVEATDNPEADGQVSRQAVFYSSRALALPCRLMQLVELHSQQFVPN